MIAEIMDKEAVLAYFTDEVGRSIHVPFKDPILDIYSVGEKTRTSESQSLEETSLVQEEKTAVLFAAPREEILDYAEIMADVSLKPSLADVSALGVYRYAKTQYPMRQHQISLFVELNVTSLNIGIFYKNELEFLRYQDLDADLSGWKTDPETGEIHWKYTDDAEIVEGSVSDQVLEMGRIMNFYRFSMHQGDRQVTDIFIYGDHPYIDKFYQQLKDQYELKIRLMEDFQAKSGKISRAFIPALGLVIEGGAES
jgi:type IV pilus assembly protein PilM